MITKKLYLDQNHIYDDVIIPLKDLAKFKMEYNAVLNNDLTDEYHQVYDLKDGNVLVENGYEAYTCSVECYRMILDFSERYSREGLKQTSASQDFFSKIDSLILKLANFIRIDVKYLDKSVASMKLVQDHFEKYEASIGLSYDFTEPLTAYFGEVLRQKYPEAKWEMEVIRKPFQDVLYHPYLSINGKRIDIIQEISGSIGAAKSEGFVPFYTRLEGTINFLDDELKK